MALALPGLHVGLPANFSFGVRDGGDIAMPHPSPPPPPQATCISFVLESLKQEPGLSLSEQHL